MGSAQGLGRTHVQKKSDRWNIKSRGYHLLVRSSARDSLGSARPAARPKLRTRMKFKKLGWWLLAGGLLCAFIAVSAWISIASSTGPFEPIMGHWLRTQELAKGGKYEAQGSYVVLVAAMLAFAFLLFSYFSFASIRYEREHPEEFE